MTDPDMTKASAPDPDVTRASALAPTAALPSGGGLRYESATPGERAEIEKALAEISMDDSNSILFFGASAQEAVTAVADEILEGVRTKDTGAAGQALDEMVTTLRAMPVTTLELKKPGLLARLSRGARPVARMLHRYEQVRRQVDEVSNRLDRHTSALMRDIVVLDRLFEKTLDYFRRLEVYIAAGEEQLRRLDTDTLPALAREAATRPDMVTAQQVADLRARRDDLERRVHDLKLTRQVVMQSLPSIRIVQQNDKALVGKISSTLANTLPLWRQQLAMALTIARSAEAAETLQKATDLTNELLTANAETLRTSTQQIRTQIERGIVDMAAVKQANDALVATIDDALRIAEEGKRQRAEAEKQLEACEAELRQAVLAGRSRTEAVK